MNDEMDYQLYVLAELRYKKEYPVYKEVLTKKVNSDA